MRRTRIVRKLGLDGNPLRRRIDKIAGCAATLLLAVFLVGAPLLVATAARWAGRPGAAEIQAARSWHQVPATLLHAAPGPDGGEAFGHSWVLARWTAPDGRARTGEILVSGGMAAGRAVPLGVDMTGSPTGAPPSRSAVLAEETAAGALAAIALAAVLLCLAWAGRRVVDRRRLAGWEAAWAAVGPQWTKRFRSRG